MWILSLYTECHHWVSMLKFVLCLHKDKNVKKRNRSSEIIVRCFTSFWCCAEKVDMILAVQNHVKCVDLFIMVTKTYKLSRFRYQHFVCSKCPPSRINYCTNSVTLFSIKQWNIKCYIPMSMCCLVRLTSKTKENYSLHPCFGVCTSFC